VTRSPDDDVDGGVGALLGPRLVPNSIRSEIDEDEVVTGSVSAPSSAKNISRLVALHDAMGPERPLSALVRGGAQTVACRFLVPRVDSMGWST
jgi:hypothetical protein